MSRTTLRVASLAALVTLASACDQAPPPPTIVVTVAPEVAAVDAGKTQLFVATVSGIANQAVVWSVTEAGGGAVTAAGIYTAPAASGTYHVVATSQVDRTRQGTATVYVGGVGTCLLNTPQPSALPATQVLSLGAHAVGETVSFTIPPGTGSVTILQQGVEQLAARSVTLGGMRLENTVIPLTVNVDGVAYYDDRIIPPDDPADLAAWNAPPGSAIGAIYSGIPSPWTGAMTFPNTTMALDAMNTSGGAPSGTWSVVVNDYAAECKAVGPPDCLVGDGTTAYLDGRYDVKVLVKPGATASTGTMDVNLHLVTNHYTAASAAADPSMARMRETLATYLARAGIALGAVNFVDETATVKARYAAGVNVDDLTPCGEVATVLRLAVPGNAMSLFLVNSLTTSQGGFTVVGQDGTIPGPATVGGTIASGALVSIANLTKTSTPTSCQGAIDLKACGADFTAYIGAHETGHFLGLYHVTEGSGTLFDPVKDTPICQVSVCAPGQVDVVNAECTKQLVDPASTCGGGDNLMFWLVDTVLSAGTISPQQSSILRASPAVR
jgi:hypothetical protein